MTSQSPDMPPTQGTTASKATNAAAGMPKYPVKSGFISLSEARRRLTCAFPGHKLAWHCNWLLLAFRELRLELYGYKRLDNGERSSYSIRFEPDDLIEGNLHSLSWNENQCDFNVEIEEEIALLIPAHQIAEDGRLYSDIGDEKERERADPENERYFDLQLDGESLETLIAFRVQYRIPSAPYIPPYVELMMQAVAELGLGPTSTIKKTDVAEWFFNNWPANLYGKSNEMIEYMATLIRRPNDMRGGRSPKRGMKKTPTK